MSNGTVLDGTVSESPSRQSSQIWELRERIAEALKKDGYCYKYDISIPLDVFYDRYVQYFYVLFFQSFFWCFIFAKIIK